MVMIELVGVEIPMGRWNLVSALMELRQSIFIDRLKWDLTGHDRLEFEQYDNIGRATYIVAHEDGRVIAGARLLRCDSSIGLGTVSYSYMIRDAVLGIIDLPRNLCWEEPPTDAGSWELTRLVSIDPNPRTTQRILNTANDHIRDLGGRQCLFLGAPSFLRMARSYGYAPRPLGGIVSNRDGRFLAFACSVRP